MKQLFFFFTVLFLLECYPSECSLMAQSVRIENNRALELYNQKDYKKAELLYKRALHRYKEEAQTLRFGLSNIYLQTDRKEQAAQLLQQLARQADNLSLPQERIAQVWHNLGNIFMSEKDYSKAIEAYKQSLRLYPKDEETRYNLALALKLNKEKPSGGGGGGEGASMQSQQQSSQQQNLQPQQKLDNGMSDKILDAYRQQEEKTRKQVEQKKQKEPQHHNKKNW